jgi:hypothetical protein
VYPEPGKAAQQLCKIPENRADDQPGQITWLMPPPQGHNHKNNEESAQRGGPLIERR